jgi:LSD1 subclass zinc finger protein
MNNKMKCPGSEIRIDEQKCEICGETIEFFTGDSKVKCPKCKTFNYRKRQSCADWCPNAEKCFGKSINKK